MQYQRRYNLDMIHTAFYHFSPIADPAQLAQWVKTHAGPLLGTVLVAPEGINGAMAGPQADVALFESALTAPSFLDGAFAAMAFKHSGANEQPFARLKVHVKREIVALGLGAEAPASAANSLSPQQWQALLQNDDVVVLDNRNHFEYRLGHFVGAVNPSVNHFREFAQYVQDNAQAWRDDGKRIAMYCTGGVRCEKTQGWMQTLGLDVWQLDGGILNYFKEIPATQNETQPVAAAIWQGDCFVFDNRIAVSPKLEQSDVLIDDVFDDSIADEAWRKRRAKRLNPDGPGGLTDGGFNRDGTARDGTAKDGTAKDGTAAETKPWQAKS